MNQISSPDIRHVLLHDIAVMAEIGIHPDEHGRRQRVRIDVDLGVAEQGQADRAAGIENLDAVVNYEPIVHAIRATVAAGHVRLVETLAERIASLCLESDNRILSARIRVKKLDAFPDVAAAGVEIERRRG